MTEDLDRQLAGMVDKARQQAEQIKKVQQEVSALTVTGQGGHGLVTTTVLGSGHIIDIAIDPDALRAYDAASLGGVVLEAVNDGVKRALMAARDRYAEVMPEAKVFDEVLARYEKISSRSAATEESMDSLSW